MFARLVQECRYELLEFGGSGAGGADLHTRSAELLGRNMRPKPGKKKRKKDMEEFGSQGRSFGG